MPLQLDRPEEADAELLALVLHKDASAALCLASLTAVLEAPGCSALKPAADIVLERFAEDATVPLRLVQALLGASEDEVSWSACRTHTRRAIWSVPTFRNHTGHLGKCEKC